MPNIYIYIYKQIKFCIQYQMSNSKHEFSTPTNKTATRVTAHCSPNLDCLGPTSIVCLCHVISWVPMNLSNNKMTRVPARVLELLFKTLLLFDLFVFISISLVLLSRVWFRLQWRSSPPISSPKSKQRINSRRKGFQASCEPMSLASPNRWRSSLSYSSGMANRTPPSSSKPISVNLGRR